MRIMCSTKATALLIGSGRRAIATAAAASANSNTAIAALFVTPAAPRRGTFGGTRRNLPTLSSVAGSTGSRRRTTGTTVGAAGRGMTMWGEEPSSADGPAPPPSAPARRSISSSPVRPSPPPQSGGGGGWDDFDDDDRRQRQAQRPSRGGGWDEFDDDDRRRRAQRSRSNGGGGGGEGRRQQQGQRRLRRGGGSSWDGDDDWNSGGGGQYDNERSYGGGGGGRRTRPSWRDDENFGRDSEFGRGGGRRGGRGGRGRGRELGRDREFGRGGRGGRGGGRGGGRAGRGRGRGDASANAPKINLRALEGAGLVHLFGLAPVLNALSAARRELEPREMDPLRLASIADDDNSGGADDEDEMGGWDIEDDEYGQQPKQRQQEEEGRERKPEAQFTPWLFVQEGSSQGRGGSTSRSAAKVRAAREIEQLAQERGVPVAHVDKGALNVLSGNRPHQGYVLRCGRLDFDRISTLPHPDEDDSSPSLWLALDEVVDPQNFGALLRSAHFLGGGGKHIGVLVCAKNSAPPSPVVSAASAGALELCDIVQTSNLPRTLNAAKDAGFRVLGAAAEAPGGLVDAEGNPLECLDLADVTSVAEEEGRPTVLVLGSEGDGLRNLVARACSGFVRIPSFVADEDADEDTGDSSTCAGVDSLNVSVTGGIMLWHLVR